MISGRWRALNLCNHLLKNGKGLALKYDTKGLFLHGIATYFEEESQRCKRSLETLVKTICSLHAEKDKAESVVHNLIIDWLAASTPIHVGIGAKILSLIIEDDKVCLSVAKKRLGDAYLSKPIAMVVDEDDLAPEFGVALSNLLGLCGMLVDHGQEDVVTKAIEADKLAGMILHPCQNVRAQCIDLLKTILDESNVDTFALTSTTSGRRKKAAAAMKKKVAWLDDDVKKRVLDNLCEVAKQDPSTKVTECLTNLALHILKKDNAVKSDNEKNKLATSLWKKTRKFFDYEKTEEPKEWERRTAYYDFILAVLKNLEPGDHPEGTDAFNFVASVWRQVAKDCRQPRIEAIGQEVQLLCEKWDGINRAAIKKSGKKKLTA